MSDTLDLTYRVVRFGSKQERSDTTEYHLDQHTVDDRLDGTGHAVLSIETNWHGRLKQYTTRVDRTVRFRSRGFTISRGGDILGDQDYPGGRVRRSIASDPVARFSAAGLQREHVLNAEYLILTAGGLDVLLAWAADSVNQGWAQR